MLWTSEQLDEFVEASDRKGGPNTPACNDFWSNFSYAPKVQVDVKLDPYGDEYVKQQLELHREIAGINYNSLKNEETSFDFSAHLNSPNPYNHPDPSALSLHIQRIARALAHAKVQRGSRILDMGCGWGLSSEIAAYAGLVVHAVDINSSFIDLINQRSKRTGFDITSSISTFEDFEIDELADIVLFYECLHHAVRPWIAIRKALENIKNGAKIVLAGEPINNTWWPNWGLRLDPLSVYCIRKFGWFESGWSTKFILQTLHREGAAPIFYETSGNDVGSLIVAIKDESLPITGAICSRMFGTDNESFDQSWWNLMGKGRIEISFPKNMKFAVVKILSFRGKDFKSSFFVDGARKDINFGRSPEYIIISSKNGKAIFEFDVEKWSPADELGTADTRFLGLHLEEISFSGIMP